MRGLANFIMGGPGRASLIVLAFAGLSLFMPLFGLVSSAALALVALRNGAVASFQVLSIAATAFALAGVVLIGDISPPLTYAALMWLPVWTVALILRNTGQLASALETGAAYGMLAVGLIYAWFDAPAALWAERLRRVLDALAERAAQTVSPESMQASIDWFSHYVSGLVAAGSVASLALSLLLGRWWQSILFNPGGFRDEFVRLRLHAPLHYFGLACLAIALAMPATKVAEVAWNLLLVLAFLFLILGFAILHGIMASKPNKRFWLLGIYVLSFLLPQLLFPLAMIGMTDLWVNWRTRLGAT